MSDAITLSGATLDCPNAQQLADFCAVITDGTVTFAGDSWATVDGPGGRIEFQTIPGYQPPRWPDPVSSIQVHLDFYVDERDATEAKARGAFTASHQTTGTPPDTLEATQPEPGP